MKFLAELKEGLSISWAAIRANKMRSVLTTLGIIIGIVTVTLMGTAIEGLNIAFLKSISSLGADVFYVSTQRTAWRTSAVASLSWSFSLMCPRWTSTVLGLRCSCPAMSRVLFPWPMSWKTSNSRSVSDSMGDDE